MNPVSPKSYRVFQDLYIDPLKERYLESLVGKTIKNHQKYLVTLTKDLNGHIVCHCKKEEESMGKTFPLVLDPHSFLPNPLKSPYALTIYPQERKALLGDYGLKGGMQSGHTFINENTKVAIQGDHAHIDTLNIFYGTAHPSGPVAKSLSISIPLSLFSSHNQNISIQIKTLQNIQSLAKKGNLEEAILECRLLSDDPNLASSQELQKGLYVSLIALLPHLSTSETLNPLAIAIQNLLTQSPKLCQEQQEMAVALGNWHMSKATTDKDPTLLKIALEYFIKGVQIANPASSPHEEIVFPFYHWMKIELIDNKHFEKILRTFIANQEGEKLKKYLDSLPNLALFCPKEEQTSFFNELHAIAKKVYQQSIHPSNQHHFPFLSPFLQQGFTIKDQNPLLDTYKKKLHFFLSRPSSSSFKTKIFSFLLEKSFLILGPPPCNSVPIGMGLLIKEGKIAPLEWALLIENEQERSYFEKLAFFIDMQFHLFLQTPSPHIAHFTALPPQQEDLYISPSFNPANPDLRFIGTPKTIAKTIQASLPSSSSRLFSSPLSNGDPNLHQTYQKTLFSFKHPSFLTNRPGDPKTDPFDALTKFITDSAFEKNLSIQQSALETLPLLEPYFTQESLELLRLALVDLRDREDTTLLPLTLEPLHTLIKMEKPLEDINLLDLSFEALLKNPQDRQRSQVFSQTLHRLSSPEKLLTHYYQRLSNQLDNLETLRKAYLSCIEDPTLKNTLALIPNLKGYRQIERIKREELQKALLSLDAPTKETNQHHFSATLTTLSGKTFYLKSALLNAILDNDGKIKQTYTNTQSRVTASPGLHFKQAPEDPNKASPFHPGKERAASSLMFRLFGHGASVGELVQFTVNHPQKGQKTYLVHISKTIAGTNLADIPEKDLHIDPQNLSNFFLSLPLLLPGDMRPANLIVQGNRLISIDNDVSWVTPMTQGATYGYYYHLYTILPFLFPNHILDDTSIQNFLNLQPGPLLADWLEELEAYNETIENKFSKFEDISKKQILRALFEKNTGGQLFSQFIHLQTFLKTRKGPLPALDVLKTLISYNQNHTIDVGEKVYTRYKNAQGKTPSEKVKWVTSRDIRQSMSMTKSQETFYKNLPTTKEPLTAFTPRALFEDIKKLLILDFGNFSFQQNQNVAHLTQGFEKIPDIAQQEVLLKALISHPYATLNLSHCSALTDESFSHFLTNSQNTLKTLTLRHCPNITTLSLTKIASCPNLEELYLSHSQGIKRFVNPGTFVDGILKFPNLKTLHLGHCELTRMYIEAPNLQFLKINNNPDLKDFNISVHPFIEVEDTGSPIFPFLRAFGQKKWEKYFGDIGTEPPLPKDIDQILKSPCPFWSSKRVEETHLLVLVPNTVNGKALTLNTLQELIKSPKTGNKTQYRYYNDDVKKELGDKSESAHWVLMTRDVIPESRNKKYDDQKALVASHAKKSGIAYELPTALEATTAILMHYIETGKALYTDDELGSQYTYTRCQEKVNNNQWPVAIGGFSSGGLHVSHIRWSAYDYGVGCCRKL